MNVDFGRTARDYVRHRAGFPESFFERLAAAGVIQAGERALDLGTGTGTIAHGLARRGLRVTGLDRSDALMAEARRLDAEAGVSIDYRVATAEATGLPDGAFALVTAGQCWHWFERDRAAAEVRRLLGPDGRLVIAHFDWLPLPGNVVEATEALILQHNPAWALGGGTGLHPQWLTDVRVAGFQEVESFSYDIDVAYSHEAWRGRIRASAGVAASLEPAAVDRFEAEHAAMLAARFPADPLAIPHRVFAVLCRKG